VKDVNNRTKEIDQSSSSFPMDVFARSPIDITMQGDVRSMRAYGNYIISAQPKREKRSIKPRFPFSRRHIDSTPRVDKFGTDITMGVISARNVR
jgi:hypothetical protein